MFDQLVSALGASLVLGAAAPYKTQGLGARFRHPNSDLRREHGRQKWSSNVRGLSEEVVPHCHYEVLGVARCASAADIYDAYHKKVEEWHLEGDSSTTEESRANFRQIKEAFEVLSDAARRALYDAGVSQAGFQVQLAKVLPSMNKLLADIGDMRKGVSNFTDRMKQDPKPSMEEMLAMLKEINKREDNQQPPAAAPAGRGRPPKHNGSPSPCPGAPVRKKVAARKARGK